MDTGPRTTEDLSNKSWEEKYWNARYQSGNTSGYGSYGEQLEKKLNWLKGIEITSILDIGCGDFNVAKNIIFQFKILMENYTGYDVSPYIVERNKGFYPRCTFKVIEGFPTGEADLLLCLDVLFHIIEDKDAETFVDNLVKLWETGKFKYLALTGYERNEDMTGHVRVRSLDYKRFGEPIIREIVEEDGSLYFYLFKHE